MSKATAKAVALLDILNKNILLMQSTITNTRKKRKTFQNTDAFFRNLWYNEKNAKGE